MRRDLVTWPRGLRWIDIAWGAFALANLVAMRFSPEWETVPFHFIWVSLTILYGFRVWPIRPTLAVLGLVMLTTGALIWVDVSQGTQQPYEMTEVPLMAAMFAAMVWHARRRQSATAESERVSADNLRLLERGRRFVQDASHELRTPITVALGHSELIGRQTQDPTIAEDAGVITDELMRLRRLVDGLLLLAGTEDPQLLHLMPTDIETIVVDTVRRWAATPRRWLLGATDPLTVLADVDRLAVALDALIENAVQHTDEDGTIEVGVQRQGQTAVLWVRDTGTGIAAEDLDRVFARFARADPGRSRHTGGFGLGLSIVQTIVEGHGGTIHVESVQGEGTTFRASLPLAASALRRDDRITREKEDVRDRVS